MIADPDVALHPQHFINGNGELFKGWLRQHGCDGIIAYEGGEGNEAKDHTSFVIYDPEKVVVLTEADVEEQIEIINDN